MDDQAEYRTAEERHVQEVIYWATLALQLPAAGVQKVFPTEDSCRMRLAGVRWPDGIRCPACQSEEVFELSTRPVFKCRACKIQFSATSGTSLHRSHVPTLLWFLAAEKMIQGYAQAYCRYHTPSEYLAETIGVSYRSAFRMRRVILGDVAASGKGLLRKSICIGGFSLPSELTLGSEEHAIWLQQKVIFG